MVVVRDPLMVVVVWLLMLIVGVGINVDVGVPEGADVLGGFSLTQPDMINDEIIAMNAIGVIFGIFIIYLRNIN